MSSQAKNEKRNVKKNTKHSKFSFSHIKKLLKRTKKSFKTKVLENPKVQSFYDKSKKPFIKLALIFGSFLNKFKSRTLLVKILYTLLLISVFRLAASITLPLVKVDQGFGSDESSFIGIMDLMGGGALRNFSIVALGISPYITASIIMQLLSSEIFPPLHRLSKSGPVGKRKINIITRILTIAFSVVQSITMIQQLSGGQVHVSEPYNTTIYKFVALPLVLIAGSLFSLFLGEQITNKGVGNGTSLIIFSGIAVSFPSKIRYAYIEFVEGQGQNSIFAGVLNFSTYIISVLLLIFIVGFLYNAERRVPIQQVGSGIQLNTKELSHLPIKVNPAGVVPVIFSMAIAVLPITIAQFLDRQDLSRIWIEKNLRLASPIGLGIFIALTFFFTIVMSIVTFNPYNVADGFKKNGTFIPGIRPGRETENYLNKIIFHLSIFSAFYLSAISSVQYIEEIVGLDPNISFGGTSLIILVTTAIETMSQLKARDQTQKITKANIKTKKVIKTGSENDSTGGLLW